MSLFASKLYGVDLGLASIRGARANGLMSFSVPGLPSGSLLIVAPFFAAHGMPPESIGVLIALDLVPDVFKTLCKRDGTSDRRHVAARWPPEAWGKPMMRPSAAGTGSLSLVGAGTLLNLDIGSAGMHTGRAS